MHVCVSVCAHVLVCECVCMCVRVNFVCHCIVAYLCGACVFLNYNSIRTNG